jgi:DNA modification methylase
MKPHYKDHRLEIYCGDALKKPLPLPDESVQCCVTSPPYFGLRDYGVDGQLGREKTPELYVQNLRQVFSEIRRVLKKDGALWLNLGDSYAASRSYQVTDNKNKRVGPHNNIGRVTPPEGCKQKDLLGIPWMVAFALRSDGWWLRSEITWCKENPMPESVTDRPTSATEKIFLLTKSADYFYDADAVRNPPSEAMLKQVAEGYNGSEENYKRCSKENR